MKYYINDIKNILDAGVIAAGENNVIDHLLLDSRKLLFPAGSLFFALKTSHRNAIQFLPELYDNGVRNFVVMEEVDSTQYIGANILKLPDALHALQTLVAHHRANFNYPVIGITGSNGKTIIKEWLHQLLMDKFSVVRSPRSYNSQIGVPLSVWQMNEHHTMGIFEAGISKSGEMNILQKIIQPTIGILTNLGAAHNEGFSSMEEKLEEKLLLFQGVKKLIYCSDHSLIEDHIHQSFTEDQLFSWSYKKSATLQIIKVEKTGHYTDLVGIYDGKNVSVSIPFQDKAYIENAIHCWCVLLYLGLNTEGIRHLLPVAMRLELKKGLHNNSIINDSYSADLSSLEIALDFLSQQQQHPKRTVILTDILESGMHEDELYEKVAQSLVKRNIDRLIGVGLQISLHEKKFIDAGIKDCSFYTSVDDLKEKFPHLPFHDEVILFKGARKFGLESFVHLMEEKVHQTMMEINLNSLLQNLSSYKALLKPGTKVMAMVKAFSYGSGSFEIANALQFHKIDYLAVAYTDEGIDLRKGGIRLPIMVMNADSSSFESLVEYNLEPDIYSLNFLKQFNHYLDSEGISEFPVHIELETGMNRLGFEEKDILAMMEIIRNGNFAVRSVFTHFVGSEDPLEDEFTRQQAEKFARLVGKIESDLGYKVIRHAANTSGINRHRDFHFDMVRLGIGLYGIDSSGDRRLELTEVSRLKSTIAQIRHLPAGETVSYNRRGVLKRDSVIATVRIGYADGYSRKLGHGKGFMLVHGQPAPVVGTVCMDMTMIDITDIPGVMEGEEVIVFGPELSVKQLAVWAETIPYEILTGISQRVKRVYYQE